MLYVYEIGTVGPEWSNSSLYMHKDRFSHEELRDMLVEVLWEVIEILVEKKRSVFRTMHADSLMCQPLFIQTMAKHGFNIIRADQCIRLFDYNPVTSNDEPWGDNWEDMDDIHVREEITKRFNEKYKLEDKSSYPSYIKEK